MEKPMKCFGDIKIKNNISTNALIISKPTPRRSLRIIFKDRLVQYLQATSLHGLKFIGDGSISLMERIFFIFAFIISIFVSGYYIYAVYMKWRLTPLLITTSSTSTSISSIPFPAITICNLNKAKRDLVQGIKTNTKNYAHLQMLCKYEHAMHIDGLNETSNWDELRQFILQVSQPCEQMLLSCRYGSKLESCYEMFEPILTDEGLCCTFNNVHPKFLFTERGQDNVIETDYEDVIKPVKWTPENGYEEDLPRNYYPRKAMGTGANMGLTIVLNASINEYFCSSTRGVGFKMIMHSPTEMPKITNYGYLIPTGAETQVIVNPMLENSAPNIRRIRQKARHCVFEDETKLKFFKVYTKGTCELECEALHLERECGCVTYYLPRFSNETVVCGLKDLKCIHQVRFDSESMLKVNNSCTGCKPGCVSLKYTPVMSTTQLMEKDFLIREKYTRKKVNLKEISVIHFFYEWNSFRARTKEEFLGFANFLADSGGILGLFLGFSMISIIEIIYFLALVPHTIVKNHINRKKRKENQQSLFKARESVSFPRTSWHSSLMTKTIYSPANHFESDFQTAYGYYGKPGTWATNRHTRKIEGSTSNGSFNQHN